ncbi:MAG: RagB/SusD family nutrient uptake outer membrane protein [Muribaculaceae bacterium]|nr:RagB/SusD family nutrient uptake outer membrane protein [Muribaculaceae bacterium]
MKQHIRHTALSLSAIALVLGTAACNDQLDLKPITEITPDDYYRTADQLANYLNAYYNSQLVNPFSGQMYHKGGFNAGLGNSDVNTDLYIQGAGNTDWFAKDHRQTPTGKVLQSEYENVRVWNYFLSVSKRNHEAGIISGDNNLIENYIGEGHFFRALAYFRLLAQYGDAPIVHTVLPDQDEVIVENSARVPRNELARYIIADLDSAISLLSDRSLFRGQRVNRECAALLKSRVALFEATFEKYHRGSGRVPGDAEWPGAKMAYNAEKVFNIDSEIDYFLTQAMDGARLAVGSTPLTTNSKVLQPEPGVMDGWNPYFEMYAQLSLANNPECLLWKEYNKTHNVTSNVPYYIFAGNNDGMTRAFTEGFLMTDGKPFYASPLYKGDESVDNVKADRDYRLQLFLWSESTLKTAEVFATPTPENSLFGVSDLTNTIIEQRNVTGYTPRKYFTYHYPITVHAEEMACPIFRIAEAMLNYIEACVEKNGAVDGVAADYWRQLRTRAGVSPDYALTVASTDLSQERQWSVYSGSGQVSALLFNVRRERMNETFNEGLRFADLIRWRSFDRMLTTPAMPEGCNFWDSMWKNDRYKDANGNFSIVCDGSTNSLLSGPEQGKYLRLCSASLAGANELKDGYSWTEAYYLYPLGAQDITSASPDRNPANSMMYQNIHWAPEGGRYAER